VIVVAASEDPIEFIAIDSETLVVGTRAGRVDVNAVVEPLPDSESIGRRSAVLYRTVTRLQHRGAGLEDWLSWTCVQTKERGAGRRRDEGSDMLFDLPSPGQVVQ
jgi:hypothetical protein